MSMANQRGDSSSYNEGNQPRALLIPAWVVTFGGLTMSDMTMLLHDTGNPVVEGKTGRVKELYWWGAILETEATISGRYRATWAEMSPVVEEKELPDEDVLDNVRRQEKPRRLGPSPIIPVSNGTGRRDKQKPVASGNVCDNCGGCRMIRTGTCETCLDCGTGKGGCT